MTPNYAIRTCIGCGRKGMKRSFARFVLGREGEVRLDAHQVLPGRGAYLCREVACLEKALKRKAFIRALRIPPSLQGRLNDQARDRLKKEMGTLVLLGRGRFEEGDLNEQT